MPEKKKNKRNPETEAPENIAAEAEIAEILENTKQESAEMLKRERDAAVREAEETKAEFDNLRERHMRLAAEYDNFRKRSQKEREATYGEAFAGAVAAFLEVRDNLDRAVAAPSDNAEALREGLALTMKQMDDVYARLGVEEIPAEGESFDPELHNAVMHAEDEAFGESMVAEVFQKGYKIGDRVVRHAMVKVVN